MTGLVITFGGTPLGRTHAAQIDGEAHPETAEQAKVAAVGQ